MVARVAAMSNERSRRVKIGLQKHLLTLSAASPEQGTRWRSSRGKFGLYELMDVKETAARILGRKTDIMTRDSIHKALRARIEADAVPVF